MVDDDEQVLAMGQMLLSSFGYKVVTANCGQKALEIVRQSEIPIDLLITDLVMPRMSGRELIENIRRVAPNLRTIYSSGYIRWAGEDSENFLLKPYTSKALLAKVRQVLAAG
jgi:CheY-like chemotaxis protein